MHKVSYSQRVLDELQAMVRRNPTRAAAILVAFGEIDTQLDNTLRDPPGDPPGDPLRDLSAPNAQLWIACVPPLVVHYIRVEPDDPARRQVLVVRPFIPVTGAGIV